jgi:hypothetical protein
MIRHRISTLRLLIGMLIGAAAVSGPVLGASSEIAKPLRVYHIGNSVTDTLNYRAFGSLVKAAGAGYTFGRHMIPGCPLWGLYVDQKSGFTEQPFGPSQQALKQFDWDVVTLQPFDRLLDRDLEPDLESCSKFIELIVARRPGTRVYIYSRWPRRDEMKGSGPVAFKPFDFSGKWERPYTGTWDQSYETRDYFVKLTAALNERFAGKLTTPIHIIPVGDVMLELDRRLRGGAVPGVASIEALYTDHIHLNPTGSYVVGATFLASLYGKSPRGVDSRGYGAIDGRMLTAIAESVEAVLPDVKR